MLRQPPGLNWKRWESGSDRRSLTVFTPEHRNRFPLIRAEEARVGLARVGLDAWEAHKLPIVIEKLHAPGDQCLSRRSESQSSKRKGQNLIYNSLPAHRAETSVVFGSAGAGLAG
jgi:hypothetical protein